MSSSLIFKAGMNDSDFAAGIKRMEDRAAAAAKKINAGLMPSGGMKGHGAAGGQARQLGDLLDIITGQYGGVMKMNAAIHTLGLGLGTAFAAVGAGMLGERVYEDTEKVRVLNYELTKIQKVSFSAAASSMSELSSRIVEMQRVKEGFEESAGTKPGQTKFQVFGRTLMNMAADGLTPGSNTTLAGRHADAAKLGAEKAHQMQQYDANKMGEKMEGQLKIQNDLTNGYRLRAELAKEQADTDEHIGALMAIAAEKGIDMTRATNAELDLHKQRVTLLEREDAARQFSAAHRNRASEVAENDKAMEMDRQTSEKRMAEREKHLTMRQRTNLLQNDVNNQLGLAKGATTLLGKAEIRSRIQDDIGQARDLAAQRALMSPHERAQQSRDERKMQNAADRAEAKLTRGMSQAERKAFTAEKAALSKATANRSTIDDGSITKLGAAFKDAAELLVFQ